MSYGIAIVVVRQSRVPFAGAQCVADNGAGLRTYNACAVYDDPDQVLVATDMRSWQNNSLLQPRPPVDDRVGSDYGSFVEHRRAVNEAPRSDGDGPVRGLSASHL